MATDWICVASVERNRPETKHPKSRDRYAVGYDASVCTEAYCAPDVAPAGQAGPD